MSGLQDRSLSKKCSHTHKLHLLLHICTVSFSLGRSEPLPSPAPPSSPCLNETLQKQTKVNTLKGDSVFNLLYLNSWKHPTMGDPFYHLFTLMLNNWSKWRHCIFRAVNDRVPPVDHAEFFRHRAFIKSLRGRIKVSCT